MNNIDAIVEHIELLDKQIAFHKKEKNLLLVKQYEAKRFDMLTQFYKAYPKEEKNDKNTFLHQLLEKEVPSAFLNNEYINLSL